MMLFRRMVSGILLALVVGSLPALAQNTTDPANDEQVLRGSNRALVFSIDELRLDGVDGGLGVRWFVGQRTALRTTLSLLIESTENVAQGNRDFGRSALGAGTSFVVEWHSRAFRKVSHYMASGFGVRFDVFSETTEFEPTHPIIDSRRKGSSIDFTVSAGLGAEVYLTRTISIAGEHLFLARVRTGNEELRENVRDGENTFLEQNLRSFTFGIGTSRLMISVFF